MNPKSIQYVFLFLIQFSVLLSLHLVSGASYDGEELPEKRSQIKVLSDVSLPVEYQAKMVDSVSKNILEFLLIIYESVLFQLWGLFSSNFWLERHSFTDARPLLKALLSHLKEGRNPAHSIHRNPHVQWYNKNKEAIKKQVMVGYKGQKTDLKTRYTDLLNNINNIDCFYPKKSVILLYIIFESDLKSLMFTLIFYLMICSFRDLKGKQFFAGFIDVMNNVNGVGSKLIKVGGKYVEKSISILQTFFPEIYSRSAFSGISVEDTMYPLDLSDINPSEFGFRLCISILELSYTEFIRIKVRFLLLFLASRMLSPIEVLLGFDIFSYIYNTYNDLEEAFKSLLFNESMYVNILRRVLILHNLDLTGMNSRFPECHSIMDGLETKSRFYRETDYQIRSGSKKRDSRRTRELRSRYYYMADMP
ncbi:secreted membrane-associated protein [Cryptosporidium canis]|uniref:Secreted membrane-associated protein n=1 Tax=Cryptosporidium canis TaxID=195482 RepID=A0A9D5HVQ9_9CRYT|nr:secreted membrane-associated protein [Cryptosporidium canis]